jgi:hypothetical protein
MIRLLLALAVFLVGACTRAPAPDEPAPPPAGALERDSAPAPLTHRAAFVAPGDTLTYTLTLASFGARATGALFTVHSITPGWRGPVRQSMTTLTSGFELVAPAAWDSAAFRLYAWGTNGSKVSRDSTLIASWKVLRSPGAPPGGTLDSSAVIALQVWPDSARLAFFETRQMCAYVMDAALRWHHVAGQDTILACDVELLRRTQVGARVWPKASEWFPRALVRHAGAWSPAG